MYYVVAAASAIVAADIILLRGGARKNPAFARKRGFACMLMLYVIFTFRKKRAVKKCSTRFTGDKKTASGAR